MVDVKQQCLQCGESIPITQLRYHIKSCVSSLPDDISSDSLVDNNLDSPIILDSEIDTEDPHESTEEDNCPTTIDDFTKSQKTTAPQTEQDTSKCTQGGQNICYHQENSSDTNNLYTSLEDFIHHLTRLPVKRNFIYASEEPMCCMTHWL